MQNSNALLEEFVTTSAAKTPVSDKGMKPRLAFDADTSSDPPDFAWNVRELLSRIDTLNHDQKWQIPKQIGLVENLVVKAGLLLSSSRRVDAFSWTQIVLIQSVVNETFFATSDDTIRQLLCDALATIRRGTGSIEAGIHNYHPALLHGLPAADARFYGRMRSALVAEAGRSTSMS